MLYRTKYRETQKTMSFSDDKYCPCRGCCLRRWASWPPSCAWRNAIGMNTDTLEEVGKQFDVTRERIRQIEAKALRKLRHPSRSEKLRSFLEGE